jgi:hypothetical protein
MDKVKKEFSRYPEAKVYLSLPPVIPGLGSSGGFEMQLEARSDATFDNLVAATDTLMYYASKRKELSSLSTSLKSDIPQIYFDVDRDKAKWEEMVRTGNLTGVQLYLGAQSRFQKAYNVDGIPRFILLDKDGVIISNDMTRPSAKETAETLEALPGIR